MEESSKILWYSNQMQLVWVEWQIEYSSYSMYGISDDNDVFSVLDLNSLIYPTSNWEQFYLCGSDIYCILFWLKHFN